MSILVVLDTNVLVSALWKRPSHPTTILDLAAQYQIQVCYNAEILHEYKTVLTRPKFKFPNTDVANLLDMIRQDGLALLAPASTIPFIDETDRKFYDIAKSVHAFLITGNTKHYPVEPFILTPAQFIDKAAMTGGF